jgi:ABC-2 type transport system ATP-binding protein
MLALFIRDLNKTYPSGTVALKAITLSVEAGDFFALLGPNGAGKSTTIGIISSLIKKTGGTVQIFGKDVDSEPQMAKAYLGLVPQEVNFSIFEKVIDVLVYQAGYYGVPRKAARERAEYYLKKLDLWDKRDQPCMRLSGGMKRRLLLARALIHAPKLLILDEPTAGVDIEVRYSIWNLLKEINQQGTTLILTTHYLEEAENLCKNVAIIHQGELIQQGTVQQLLNQSPVETFILDLSAPITHLPTPAPFVFRWIDPLHIEVEVKDSQSINALFAFLQQQAIQVKSLRNKANRLEALFLSLTAKE